MNHANRSDKVRVTAFSLDKEARLILERCAVTQRGRGHFLSRLLYEYEARLEAKAERDVDYKALRDLYGLPVKSHAGALEE